MSSTAPGLTRQLLVLGFASFTSMASMRACDAILPRLADEFAVTTGTAAQTISAFAVAYGLLQLLYGPLGDRHGKTRVMAGAAVFCALANLAIALSPTLGTMIGARLLAGAASGGIVPLSLALIGDRVAYDRRQEVLSRLMLATIFGMITGQWIGGLTADHFGWRLLFFALAAAFGLVALLLAASARREPAPGAGNASTARRGLGGIVAPYRGVLRERWARWLLAATAIEGAFAFAAVSFVPTYLHAAFGLSLGESGGVMALFGAGGLVYVAFAKPLIRRFGERGLALLGATAVGLAMAMLAFGPRWEWAIPACLAGGLGLQMLHGTLQANATQMSPQWRGTAVSLFVVCLFGGQSLGVLAGAALLDLASARWVFGASMVVVPLLGLGLRHGLALRDRWQASPSR